MKKNLQLEEQECLFQEAIDRQMEEMAQKRAEFVEIVREGRGYKFEILSLSYNLKGMLSIPVSAKVRDLFCEAFVPQLTDKWKKSEWLAKQKFDVYLKLKEEE